MFNFPLFGCKNYNMEATTITRCASSIYASSKNFLFYIFVVVFAFLLAKIIATDLEPNILSNISQYNFRFFICKNYNIRKVATDVSVAYMPARVTLVDYNIIANFLFFCL